jgi:hypothetical protein
VKSIAELQTAADLEAALNEAQAVVNDTPHLPDRSKGITWVVEMRHGHYYANGLHYTKTELRDKVSAMRERPHNPTIDEWQRAGYTPDQVRAMIMRLRELRTGGMVV